MATVKDKFINKGDGWIGVTTLDSRGEKSHIAVAPGDEVWLSEDEQALTANGPRDPANNPLANGQLVLEAEGVELRHARPLRPTRPVEDAETGAAPAPAGDAAEGSRPTGEEVGTPDADEQAKRKQEADERQKAVQENVDAAARTRPKPKAKAAA